MYGAAMVGHCQETLLEWEWNTLMEWVLNTSLHERAPETLPQNLEMGTMKPWNGFD